jgi:hypothetical protein
MPDVHCTYTQPGPPNFPEGCAVIHVHEPYFPLALWATGIFQFTSAPVHGHDGCRELILVPLKIVQNQQSLQPRSKQLKSLSPLKQKQSIV